MIRLIEEAGLSVLQCVPTNLNGNSRSATLNRITFGLVEEFLAVQYIMKSTKR